MLTPGRVHHGPGSEFLAVPLAAFVCLLLVGPTKCAISSELCCCQFPSVFFLSVCQSVSLFLRLPVFLPFFLLFFFLKPRLFPSISSKSLNHWGIIQLSSFGGCRVLFWNWASCFQLLLPSPPCRRIREWIMNFHAALQLLQNTDLLVL